MTSCGRKGGEGVKMKGGTLPEQEAESLEVVEVTRNSNSVVICIVKETTFKLLFSAQYDS
jgi:hypothetical protein